MIRRPRVSPRVRLALSLGSACALAWTYLLALDAGPTATQQSNFMGGSPRVLEVGDLRTQRLEFPAGSRSNWHTHPDGQLLMIEEGRARTQERGRPVREMHPGQPWYTPAGVEHWHGAAPDQNSIQWTIYAGQVTWLEPVDDAAYHAPVTR